MGDISKVIDVALAEVGYLEKKSNSQLDSKTANAGYGNYTKYARDLDNISGFYNGKKNGYAWCDIFVDWCFVQAFGTEKALELLCQPKKSTGAGCEFSMNFYRQKGQLYSSPKSGDQIFFKENGEISHTGLVYKVENGKVYTVEGNTSSTAGVVANGGCVAKKSYNLNSGYIAGYGRPKYDESDSNNTDSDTSEKIAEDGIWGIDTTIKAQKFFGTTIDGVVSNQYSKFENQNPGLLSSTFEWREYPNSYGSELIRAIQKLVGAKVDGHIGPDTIRLMQKFFGCKYVDGYVSNPSDVVKAFQKWLNTK